MHNSLLVNALMLQLQETYRPTSFDQLELTNDPFLEKNLEFMLECVEDIGQEQYKFQQHQRLVQRQQQQLQSYLNKRVRLLFV